MLTFKNSIKYESIGYNRGLVVERVPGDQGVHGSNPALGKNFLAINFTASKFATIFWPEGDKTSRSTSVLDRGQVASGIGKKKVLS